MGRVDIEEAGQGQGQQEERILVSVRVRPLNEKEAARNEVVDWECVDHSTIVYSNHLAQERSVYPFSYTFDRVFKPDCSTRQVYEEGAKAVVLSAINGINSSVFAYGQTSSGKTFTMSGITEYTMVDVFDYIQKHKERIFQLKFSAMEIYNESVRDLLTADSSPLRLLDDPERGTVIEKLTEETLRDWHHFQDLLAVCEAQRQIGETFLNEASSRSHQILRLTIESSTREYLGKNNSSTLAASLNFVDLAGSERASQALSAGSRLKEGSHINRSLLTLGTVIRKLSKGGTGHIPYRDSKLTRILQSSLGGNARTAVICTMSPARSYAEQSRNTLLFASCAKDVTTNARVNVVLSDKALVKHLQRELARLEVELRTSSPPAKSDATELIRDKDSKIEELERRVRELTQQLDVAQSQIHELQQEVGDRSPNPVVWGGETASYPKLIVRQSSEGSSSDSTVASDNHSFDDHTPVYEASPYMDRNGRHSYDGNDSISDFDENNPPTSPFERIYIETPSDVSTTPIQNLADQNGQHSVCSSFDKRTTNYSKSDPYVETGEQTPNSSESTSHPMSERNLDNFGRQHDQVSTVRGGQSPYFLEFDQINVSDVLGEQTHASTEVEKCYVSKETVENTSHCNAISPPRIPTANIEQVDNDMEDYCREVQCIEFDDIQRNTLPLKEETQLELPDQDNYGCPDDEHLQEDQPSNMNPSLPQDYDESPDKQLTDELFELKNVDCLEMSNYYSGDLEVTSPPSAEKVKHETKSDTSPRSAEKVKLETKNDSPNGSDEFSVRPEDVRKKLSVKCDSGDAFPQSPSVDSEVSGTPASDIRTPNRIDYTEKSTPPTETKEVNPAPSIVHPQIPAIQVKEITVGLNPQDDLDATSPQHSDTTTLQRDIIQLWDACNIPLVYRTHFFLLFIKVDPTDTIYQEVERRRLSCIKDAFSWGNSIDLDTHHKLTPCSSRKTLHRERVMLARLMERRLSSQERLDLYVKWGISLDSKRRRSQLAHRLWVDTLDMNHIEESASVVAKLVRFSEPQIPKEVFGLNLMTNQGRRRSFGWKINHSL